MNNDVNSANNAVIVCDDITKTFTDGALSVNVLHNISLSIKAGQQLAIVGTSGSGKSTLLHLLGGLSEPTSGHVYVNGQNINQLSAKAQGKMRNQNLGFVYQFHHLLPEFTALENVAMPLLIRKENSSVAYDRAAAMLKQVGLDHRVGHKPAELSGGERQRAAIARALVTQPKCVLADEPTGNLDHKTALSIHELLLGMNQQLGTSIVIVTHDLQLAAKLDHVIALEDGKVVPFKDKH